MHKQAPSSAQMEPYRRTVDDVVAALGTDRQSGLGQTQAQERLERYGQNQLIAETPLPKWRKFLTQFADVLVILLIIAASISGVLWFFERNSALPYDAIAIFAIVLLNAWMDTSSRPGRSGLSPRCARCLLRKQL
jgi:Ca2+-transporting ATPase